MNKELTLSGLVFLLGLTLNSAGAQRAAAVPVKLPYDRTCPVIYDNSIADKLVVAWYRNTGSPRAEEFERRVFDPAGGSVHDVIVTDVDGDLDMVSRPWQPSRQNAVGGKIHVDFLENLLHQKVP